MKKKVCLILITILICLTSVFVLSKSANKNNYLTKVLESEEYSYLPQEAKNYIEKMYEETGEVLHTEKNKVANEPYLNPAYVEYMSLSEEEKAEYSLIPDPLIIDYEATEEYVEESFPASIDLRNLNGKNYLTPLKNQGSEGVCWAMATVENAETYLMYKSGVGYNSSSQIFSVRQLDYATSTDGMVYEEYDGTVKSWSNTLNGSRELGSGGNTYISYFAFANGISLTDESVLPWNTLNTKYNPEKIFNFANSLYEVDEFVRVGGINSDTATQTDLDSFKSEVKHYFMLYGGPYVGTISTNSTCAFINSDGNYVIKSDDCYNLSTSNGHAMQLIGWDDNYTYAYCDAGQRHYSVSGGGCSTGTYTTGRGAWILRNSWGNSIPYLYLTYDSTRVDAGFVATLRDMSARDWDNNYHKNYLSGGLYYWDHDEVSYETKGIVDEKIQKIKFFAASKGGTYTLSITANGVRHSNIATVTVDGQGIHTIDLSDKNIVINSSNPNFSVNVVAKNGATIYMYATSVFTKNLDSTKKAKSYNKTSGELLSNTNPLYVSGQNQVITLEHFTKNIPAAANLTYQVKLSGTDYTSSVLDTSKISTYVLDGYAYSSIKVSDADTSVCGKTYSLDLKVGSTVVKSIPFKRICNGSNTTSTIRFNANNGTGKYTEVEKPDLTNIKLMKSDGTQNEDIGDVRNFFSETSYIKSWNTKADGTGTEYKDNDLYIDGSMNLYAQWATPHSYKIRYECASSVCNASQATGFTNTSNYAEKVTIASNTLTNLDSTQAFLYWKDSKNNIYYEEESVNSIASGTSPYNNGETVKLTANWANNYKTVTFNSNGGTGSMKSINVETSKDVRLKNNLFTKARSQFLYWNTKNDGTGTTYEDGATININKNITLYAIWDTTTIKITYNSNNSSGETSVQEVEGAQQVKLNKNTFTYTGYTFDGWNTKNDGTGTSYADESMVDVTRSMTLYAKWKANTYKIVFNANTGTGEMSNQTISYDETVNLTSNAFTKTGYTFDGWNTKADGTGTNYTDGQSIKNLTSVNNKEITLYAKWKVNTYKIVFDSNGGEGTMSKQTMTYGVSARLTTNAFTRTDYVFDSWNTKADGTGTKYTNKQSVKNLTSVNNKEITLYAIWKEAASVVFNTEDYIVDDDEGIIDMIQSSTTVNDYISTLNINALYSYEMDISGNALVYTGSKIRIYEGSNLLMELTNIVRGDIDGDGASSSVDYVLVKKHIMGTQRITDAVKSLAADMNSDEEITSLDYVKIKNSIMSRS